MHKLSLRFWSFRLMTLLGLLVLLLSCGVMPPETRTPTPTVPPTSTPRPSATPLPPRPEIPFTPVPPDMLSPIVVQRSPQRGEYVAPDGAIQLVFDKAMDQQAVAKALRVERAGAGESVEGRLTWGDARTLTFEPAAQLPRDTVFDVILTQDAIAETGEPLSQPYTFRFSTAGYLNVGQVMPAPDTTKVETDATITVIFNRPVVPLTTLAEMEDLPDPLTLDPPVEGEGAWLNTSIYVFTPEAPLAGGVTYRATVAEGLEDVAGAVLAEDYTWHFTTAPPEVVWIRPRPDSTLVDINTAITVQFNQPVDPASVEGAFRLQAGGLLGASGVRGAMAVDGATVTFTPTRALEFDTRYTVSLDAGVTSTAGGEGMTQPFTSHFTTVPLPRILETFPKDMDRNAPPRTEFRIVFNTPIDPTTVMNNLTMTPPLSPTQVHTYFSRYNNTFSLYFGAEASSEYRVVIDEGIADPYGNTIPRGRTVRFRTSALPPSYQLRVPDFIGTYDAALPAQLVVGHLNVTRLDLRLYRLPVSALTSSPWEWQNRDKTPDRDALLRDWEERFESPLNQQQHTVINLTETAAGTLSPGVYLLEAEAPELEQDRYQRTQRHILVVSDLNLTLKTGPEEAMIWATDLDSGEPVANLDLMVVEYDQGTLGSVTTDAEGVARLDLSRRHHTILAYSESPFAAVSDNWQRGISPWDFGVSSGLPGQTYRAYIYTDRPIYRPGQTVYFKGVLRSEDDALYALPGVNRANVTVRDVTGEELFNDEVALSALGTFDGRLDLAEGASLGQYVIDVSFADHYANAFFQVAAYRPPEFEVTVRAESDEIQRGDDLDVVVALSYFFGGPLADTSVSWNVLADSYRFEPPWGGRYSFSDVDDPYRCFDCWWYSPPAPASILSGSGTTDDQGELTVALDGGTLAEALEKGARRVTIEATAVGPDNQQIAGRTSVVVHPGPYYIGLSPQQYVSQAGDETGVDIVAVDWEGERLSDRDLTITLYRRAWINTFVENETGGGYWSWETEETLIDEVDVTTDELGEAVATFVPPEGGSYHVVAEPASPAPDETEIRSSIFLWVSGSDYVSWRRENHDRITLVSDKTTYEVGETAEILIPSPFEPPHMALVTVEREGVRRHEVVRLESNSAIYRLPILEEDIPNIYVSVVLVQPRGSGVADFKMGLLPISVNLAPKTLTVNVEPDRGRAEPGDEVTYTLTALDPEGRPVAGAGFSLDVVDKAVLSLQPRSRDILSGLYARRSLQVTTASALSVSVNRYQEELAEDLDLAEMAAGLARDEAVMEFEEADGAMPMAAEAPMATMTVEKSTELADTGGAALPEGVDVREEFADTAFWAPTLVTDEEGRASATVTLPDNLTTWVARGVGLTEATIVGEGDAEVVATKPLLVRPVAPRFFVVDDRAQLAANVSNNTEAPLEVEVGLTVEGVAIDEATPALQTVTIPARSESKVTWWITVDDVTEADLIFSAQAGEYADASRPRLTTGPEGTLAVLRYTAPDTVGTAGQLVEGGSRTEAIALPPVYDDRQGQLTVQLDPSLAAGMQEGLSYLEHYEYECTEQTVSRFLPNVLTYRALRSLGIENPELANRLPDLVEEGLTKLGHQQNPDGGWGWWPSVQDPRSNPHISAYVVFALLKAREADFAVKPQMLQNGLAYVQAQVKDTRSYANTRDANRQAWLLYVLAEADAAPQATVDDLFEARERLSTYARAYLAQTLWLRDPADGRLATLLSDINNAAILSATGAHWEEAYRDWWAMNTDTRTTAIVLDTLAKLDPENELIPNAVRWLMVAREVGIWETTQETAWALIALTDWMVETGELDADYDFALFLNEEEQARASATRETVDETVRTVVPISDLAAEETNALTIARTEGPGRLYYTAHLRVYLPVEEIEAADRGFVVQRRYTLASCEAENRLACPEVREVKLGDVIRVDLTLITPHDRYYVVVEDPLPAGGEAIDTGLATTSLLAMGARLERQDSRFWWWWNWYSRSELRDEKVVLFADYLSAGTYEYSYTFRATLPGDYHVIPTTAGEFYFPEVFGRSEGRMLTVGQ